MLPIVLLIVSSCLADESPPRVGPLSILVGPADQAVEPELAIAPRCQGPTCRTQQQPLQSVRALKGLQPLRRIKQAAVAAGRFLRHPLRPARRLAARVGPSTGGRR